MYKRTPIEILRKLTKKEINGWLAFLNNPEHNKNKDIINLANYFNSFHPKFNSPKLQKDLVISTMFELPPGEEISQKVERKFNHLFSDYSKKLKTYCAFLSMKKEEQEIDHHYQKFLDEKGLGELNFNFLKRNIGKQKPENTWQRIEHLKNVNHFYYNPLFSKFDSINAPEIIEYLIHEPEVICIQLQLKYLCELVRRSSIIKEPLAIKNVLSSVLKKARQEHITLDLESECYHLFLESTIDPGMAESFEKRSIDYFEKFPDSDDCKVLYVMLLNHRISKIHISETRGAVNDAFSWYLLGIKYGFIINDKKIQITHFINLIGLAIEVKQVEKLHNTFNKIFGEEESMLSHIDNFTNKENEKIMEEVKIICEAYLHFNNENYENCRKIYGKNFKYPNFAVLAYRLMVKANMEIWLQNKTETLVLKSLKSSIDAFKKYLHRNDNRISEVHANLNKQFIKYLNIILKNNEKQTLERIKFEISSTPNIASKWWLVDKIEEMQGVDLKLIV